ncbi:MAG: hypothetical protein Q8O03_08960 [Nanoarchaeota archaeon]|nr:hypothetical protein [Nanoarchaeota archaeon]
MKIPKTFMPNKSLEERTNHLLNAEDVKPEGYKIDEEAEKFFPGFINYLKKHYKIFTIRQVQEVPERSWRITIPKQSPKLFDDVEIIGGITGYRNKHSGAVEYGYKGGVDIKGAYVEITYRECFKYFDKDNQKCVKRMLPLRCDNNKDVPFP